MPHTRRSILKAAALAGPALFVPSGALVAFDETPRLLGADGRPIGRAASPMTRSLLAGHVGSDFVAEAGGAKVALRLVEVEDVPNAAAAKLEGSEETFAARFEDSSGVLLSQGTYTLDHDYLGRLWFFLVPVDAPSARAQTYEAIFNNAPVGASPPRKRRSLDLRPRPRS